MGLSLFSSVDDFHLGESWVGAQHHGHLLLLGAEVKKCSCSHRVEQCGVGSEVLIMMCKVSLVLLVHLPASMFHALCHPGWATAEDPDLLHLGKKGAKGVRLQHQFSLHPAPLDPLLSDSFGHGCWLSNLSQPPEAFGEVVTFPWSCQGHGGRMGAPQLWSVVAARVLQ